jgi:predicted amidohydrolase YtcJ
MARDGVSTPKEVLKNAKKAIDAGPPGDIALRAFTANAAEILGVDDRLGSIEPGKIANLVVADGDLFNEKTKVKMAFIDGRRLKSTSPVAYRAFYREVDGKVEDHGQQPGGRG